MELNELKSWQSLSEQDRAALAGYVENRFEGIEPHPAESFEFIGVWKKLAMLSELTGAAAVINKKVTPKLPVEFCSPESVRLEIYDSIAGEIPIIYADDPRDFEALVTNIIYKGKRPENLSRTGASFASGKTSRFIILSSKPYSNVPAAELGLEEKDWAERSMTLRRSHECTHYYTKQVFGITNNILHDELIADFIGLYDAFGFYRAEWFLRFMGVINGSGGRLVVYTEGLSDNAKAAVSELLTAAAEGLERWSHTDEFKSLDNAGRINKLCRLGLLGCAGGAESKE